MAEPEEPRRRSSSSSRGDEWTPIPDPTLLTTQQLMLAVSALKELLFVRLDAMDKAVELLHEDVTRVPTDVDKQIVNLRTLMEQRFEVVEEKFHSIGTQFKERDTRVEQTAKDTKVAVDAALQAAEKAVGKQNESFALSIDKSEKATMKQIDQQGILIQTATTALNDKIDDIKDRLTLIEGKGAGQTTEQAAHTTSTRDAWGIVAVVVAVIAVAVAVVIPLIIRG